MRKALGILCIVGIFISLLSGCSGCSDKEYQVLAGNKTNIYENHVTEQTPVEDKITINEVHVTEQPLSEINTDESDPFAKCYNSSQPFLVSNNGVHSVFPGNSAEYYQYFENLGDEPAYVGLPQKDDFITHVVIDNVIYGTENAYSWYSSYIIRYKDGVGERLTDEPVEGCYFAEEGIYYQSGNKIKVMDYNGQNSKPIVEIPDELYCESVSSEFIVYRGNLWYCYDEYSKEPVYPLWCYDFNGTFTTFDKGRIDAVNNGFIYYQEPYPADRYLYRFNCETYTVERVGDSSRIFDYAFSDNYIFHISFDSSGSTSHLYRMNQKENEKILSPESLRHSNDLLCISCVDNRIFVTGHEGMFYSCLAEIDADGNIIRIIHEDEYW